MASIASWIYDKPLRGNYTFTHDEVAQAFPDMSAGSIARALTRVVSKGRIMSPLRGFYVIVPDEYVFASSPAAIQRDDRASRRNHHEEDSPYNDCSEDTYPHIKPPGHGWRAILPGL